MDDPGAGGARGRCAGRCSALELPLVVSRSGVADRGRVIGRAVARDRPPGAGHHPARLGRLRRGRTGGSAMFRTNAWFAGTSPSAWWIRRSARQGGVAGSGRRHLLQLVAVKRRQAEGRSLAEIQAELAGATDEALAAVACVPDTQPVPDVLPAAPARFWTRSAERRNPVAAEGPGERDLGREGVRGTGSGAIRGAALPWFRYVAC